MQEHDRTYSVFEFRRKYVCDNEMWYNITKEGIMISFNKYVSISQYN